MGGNYLMHYRTPGSKNGVRRWTNPDGTLNEAGKRRYYGKYGYGNGEVSPAQMFRQNQIRAQKSKQAEAARRRDPIGNAPFVADGSGRRGTNSSLYPIGFNTRSVTNDNKGLARRVEGAKKWATNAYNTASSAAKNAYGAVSGAAKNAYGAVSGAAKNAYGAASGAAKNAYGAAKTAVGQTGRQINNGAMAGNYVPGKGALGRADQAYRDARSMANRTANAVSGAAKNAYNTASNAAKNALYGKQTMITRGALEGNMVRRGGAVNAAKNAYNTASGAAKNAYNTASGAAKNAYNTASGAAKNAYNTASGAAKNAYGSAKDWANNAARNASDFVKGAVGKPISPDVNNIKSYSSGSKARESVENAYNDASKWATNAYNDASKWATNAYNDASKWAGNAAKDVSDWGKNAYNDASKWAGNAAKDVGDWTKNAADKVSDVASDSFNKAKGFIGGLFSGNKKKKKK